MRVYLPSYSCTLSKYGFGNVIVEDDNIQFTQRALRRRRSRYFSSLDVFQVKCYVTNGWFFPWNVYKTTKGSIKFWWGRPSIKFLRWWIVRFDDGLDIPQKYLRISSDRILEEYLLWKLGSYRLRHWRKFYYICVTHYFWVPATRTLLICRKLTILTSD